MASLGGDELGVESIGEPRNDFVLHVQEVGQGLFEAIRPHVIADLCVDKLHVHAHAIAAALDAALQNIADIQFTTDLLQIDRLALIGESGATPDDECAGNASVC